MTTPDPSREAFYAWLRTHEDEVGALDDPSALAGWQAAMAHKGAAQNRPESEQTRMDAGSAVLPNQAYRMLIPDVDIIRPDDEYLSDDTTTWKPVGRSIFVGMPHVRAFKPGRRKIEGST
ncbi:hypothetical protein [Comamonas sp. JNW]|uniref:hypothetical protein n=1 Tax=Comamonas sp. JNW TaxID=2170731 RepID=UPI000DE7AB02|nr:hypothetical protein [Comamonas sp. JNW]PWB21368.1 hypothetical protein DCO45_02930 [Comamonas sp. JNW]